MQTAGSYRERKATMGRLPQFPAAVSPGNYIFLSSIFLSSVFFLPFFFFSVFLSSILSWAKDTVPIARPRPIASARNFFMRVISLYLIPTNTVSAIIPNGT